MTWPLSAPPAAADQSYATARLVGGGANPYRGRLEVFIKAAWGTVSSESLDAAGVAVLCRQMGLTAELTGQACAPKYFVWDQFRTVGDNVPVYLDELRCIGSEARWDDCKSKGVKSKYDHTTDVGLQCCEWPGGAGARQGGCAGAGRQHMSRGGAQ